MSVPRRVVRGILLEAWPVLVVVFGGLAAVGHIATTAWEGVFYYNADSLVLALVDKSIQAGEPFQWVFSTQVFLFPEAVFYFLSTMFTDNPRVAFSTNAVINVVALYTLLRAVAHQLSRHSRHRFVEISIALGATMLYVIYSLLEPVASPNGSGIATPFLFGTYYYGVTLGGLAIVALTLWVSRSFNGHQIERHRSMVYAAAVILIAGLVGFSNPLFIFQVTAPMVLTLLVLVFMDRIGWRTFLLPSVSLGFAVLLGAVARQLVPEFFATGVGRYFSLTSIPAAIKNLYSTLLETLSSPEGILKLMVMGILLLTTFVLVIFALYAQARPALAARVTGAEVFVLGFVAVSATSVVLGQVFTGSTTNRYLQPIVIFPLLTVVVLGVYGLRRLLLGVRRLELRLSLARFGVGLAAAASAVILLVGGLAIPSVAAATDASLDHQADCFDDFVGTADINGVGSFWISRPLDLYGTSNGRVLQVTGDLSVFPWMNDLASYDGRDFSYVVDDVSTELDEQSILSALGEPRAVIECPAYQIYDYSGTAGEKTLTQLIADSLRAAKATR